MATKLPDHDSVPSSTTMGDEKIAREAELANAGDLETARSRSEEKVNLNDEPEDPYMVKWNGTDDPENPLNFSSRKKLLVMVMIAAIAFLTYTLFFVCRNSPQLDLLVLQCFRRRYPMSWQLSILPTQFWGHFQCRCLSLVMPSDHCSLFP